MALEKLTVKDRYTPPGIEPEAIDIWIDFSVGEDSLSGDEELVEMIKNQAQYMPKEPCKRVLRIETSRKAYWGAQPFNNREDFKALLFVMSLYIVGDREINWVKSDKPLGDHFIYADDSTLNPYGRDYDDPVVVKRRAVYYAKLAEHCARQAEYFSRLVERLRQGR